MGHASRTKHERRARRAATLSPLSPPPLSPHATDPPWTPFVRASVTADGLSAGPYGVDGSALDLARDVASGQEEIWINSRYQVNKRQVGEMTHLSIKRLDKGPARDWRDMQRIKNELVGPECEGVELYPAEARLVDSANQFHLWVVRDPGYRFPFGWVTRFVSEASYRASVQRPWDADDRPSDLIDQRVIEELMRHGRPMMAPNRRGLDQIVAVVDGSTLGAEPDADIEEDG